MYTPYSGNEPYIFISYAHKDTSFVAPIIQKLMQLGFRVWYDVGIEGGFEWPEFIATRLFGSGCVLAFISANSINSKNCRREINFAIEKDKPLLAIYLDDCEVPLGMQMQLNTLQAFYCTTPADTDALIQKLQHTQLLQICLASNIDPALEAPKEEPPPAPVQPPEPIISAPEPKAASTEIPPEEVDPWVCSCGKNYRQKAGRCSCGAWRCSCGRVHASYVSSCACGVSKRKMPQLSPAPCRNVSKNQWQCTCGRIHPAYVSSCVCGLDKSSTRYRTPSIKHDIDEDPATQWKCTCGRIHKMEVSKCSCGNWHCTCGRVHAPYVSSCVCGNSKTKLKQG